MQRIEVKNFGPLKDVSIDIANIVVLIGEQASGKSTLAKLVYFFKTINYDVYNILAWKDVINYKESVISQIQSRFSTYFDESLYGHSSISFEYDTGKTITFKNGALQPSLFLDTIINETADLQKTIQESRTQKTPHTYTGSFIQEINKPFGSNQHPTYIPASRNISTSYGKVFQQFFYGSIREDILDKTLSGNIDLFMIRDFLDFMASLTDIYRDKQFSSFVQDERNDAEYLVSAIKLATKILHGEYVNKTGNEFIETNDGTLVPLNKTSTGQQESIRILQDLFHTMVTQYANFRIIEEPEAHLFPTAQKQLVEMIALFITISKNRQPTDKNQVFITTHSPYILAAFNNLLLAGKVGIENDKIDSKIWIKEDQIRAYKMEDGKSTPIIDNELGLIKNEEIDEASRIINEAFDFIDNLK